MIPITDVRTMRERDAATIAGGISGRELMLRAGQGIFASHHWHGKTAIVCGSGNNAGDGYVLALLLREKGLDVTVYLLDECFSADGSYYYEKCRDANVTIRHFEGDTRLCDYDTVVDCIFGTGFHGTVEEAAATVIERINQSGAFVISVDINSGLGGDSGQGEPCVRSDLTVSVGSYKSGLFLGRAKEVIGTRRNVDIGISMPAPSVFLAEKGDFKDVLKPRAAASHKGNYGYVTVMGGSVEYAGAVKLANMSAAALRAGCGVARLAVPSSVVDAVSPFLLESTLLPLPSDETGHMRYDADTLDAILSGSAALSVGMGWGKGKDHADILAHLLTHGSTKLVIDADGLNTLANMDLTILSRTSSRVVLTPHLKEFERLSGIPIETTLSDPITHAKDFARRYGVILLLKGACTVVTDGEKTILVDRGCAGMATAGSGDVLSGILTGLLGYAPASVETVACGAYIAGVAGELAEHETNPISMVASDTVAQIGKAISEML